MTPGTISTTFTVTGSGGGISPGGGNPLGGGIVGGGGSNPSGGCNPVPPAPAPLNPYDDQQTWTSLGNGNERFSWVHHTFTVQTTRSTDANGCSVMTYKQVDDPTPMSKDYTASQTQGVISELTYDPGIPGNMWLPISVGDWNVSASGSGVWAPLDQAHGWTGNEVGGPAGSQLASTLTLGGQQYHTYGTGQGQGTPWAYARPGSGFGFRIVWTGSPHSLPTGGSVTYSMTNPDRSNTSWTKDLVINTKTLVTQGTSMPALNTPPAYANEASSLWTDIPHFVFDGFNEPQLASWDLSENPSVVYQRGAHIDVTITIHTPSGDVTYAQPDMVTLFSYPAWYMDHTSDNDLLDAAQKAEQYVRPQGTLQTIGMNH